MGTKHFIPVLNLLQNGNQTFRSRSEPTSEYEGNAQNALYVKFRTETKLLVRALNPLQDVHLKKDKGKTIVLIEFGERDLPNGKEFKQVVFIWISKNSKSKR